MPRIPNNLRERAIGMLDAGMSTEHVARHVGCSSRAIRNLRIRFRTTGSTNNLPRRGRPRVITRGQDRDIMNTHLGYRPVLHDWCNKGRGICYPVCGMVHIK